MSDRIDHAAAAREWLAAAERPDMNLDETTAFAHVAQVHATLALVEQQRIANLIALAESGRTTVNGARQALAALYSGNAEEGSAHMALLPEIRDALGIRE